MLNETHLVGGGLLWGDRRTGKLGLVEILRHQDFEIILGHGVRKLLNVDNGNTSMVQYHLPWRSQSGYRWLHWQLPLQGLQPIFEFLRTGLAFSDYNGFGELGRTAMK
ncbi:hypothetical protein [Desulfocicer vacuolatum]|uniref:hypothetical protein n=1 Tax=Desulfocicer vacuolatum TaxID=2298 RepID=UPI0009FD3272|nr:hypothetical protein [Desulfocicer vacuolatum]